MRTPQLHSYRRASRPASKARGRRFTTVLVAVLVLGSLTSCGVDTPADTPSGIPFELYTHCGITELTFDGARYSRVGGLLDDGSGNPPRGWGNPFQEGWLVLGEETVTFQDSAGHSEVFTPQPTTAPTLPPCA